MLGKLMKYELRATGRTFLPLYAAILVSVLVTRLLMVSKFDAPSAIGGLVVFSLFIALGVITLLILIQRFNKNLLGDEGYLMNTLPVTTGRLIWSKLLTFAIWAMVSCIVGALSILILSGVVGDFFPAMWKGFGLLFQHAKAWEIVRLVAEFLLMLLLGGAMFVLQVYLSISIGHLFNSHRALMGFVAYIAINTIWQILFTVCSTVGLNLAGVESLMNINAESMMLLASAGMAAVCALYMVLTRYILKNKLNLE